MLSKEIRSKFLNYFKDKQHMIVPSSSVVPHDDPTLLFMNAGMNQFKDVFLGKAKRDYTRATSSQKCIRVGGKHNDLDNVGHTSRHVTFFEMLGNFSFSDYFKKEAIRFAWEVTTEIFKFPVDKLWITIYHNDDEAFDLWKEHIDETRIVRIDTEDNFWSMGDTGPCGPCSELFFDRGPEYGNASSPKDDTDGERYIEFWNLVFMQFDRDSSGTMNPLPKQSIDTGAGLERVVSLMMGVGSVFETDILRHIIARVEKVSGKTYDPKDTDLAPAFHVIADHLRALAFAIADGAQPGNIERGYVLRKVLRRAVRYGRKLGMNEPFMGKVLPALMEMMGDDFHELKSAEKLISEILQVEEESFLRTLKRGGNILNTIIEKTKDQISGADAFKLKDTYGFPIEEILLIAKDSDLTVDLEAFEVLEKEAKEKSRVAKKTHVQKMEPNLFEAFLEKHGTSEFIGYDDDEAEGSVIGLIVDGKFVDKMHPEDEGLVILDKTPFYAEKGGQIGDEGMLEHKEAQFAVEDCQSPFPDVITHVGKLKSGILLVGEPVVATVNAERRNEIRKHHTATHLLHWALQDVVGEYIRQAGSLVEPNRLRFDFNHHKPLSQEEIRAIEMLINHKIWGNSPVHTKKVAYNDIQNHPEIKQFFGEKYGSKVRLVNISDFSRELCGGTHVDTLGSIGFFRIAKESSIAKGVRRIEAVTGPYAEDLMYASDDKLRQIAEMMQTLTGKVEERINSLLTENTMLKDAVKSMRQQALLILADELMKEVITVDKVAMISTTVDVDPKELPILASLLIDKMKTGIVALALLQGERCQLYVRVSEDLVQQGIHANEIIKQISPAIQGGGGGKKDTAQAGGKNPEGINEALELVLKWLDDAS